MTLAVALLLFATTARAATFSVTNENVSGAGSLRQAILDANATVGADLINFTIPGGGVKTIVPTVANPLPVITEAVTIDGSTHPSHQPTGRRAIEIDGSSSAGAAIAIDVAAGVSATIIGLNIHSYGTAIRLQGPGSIVRANYIGTNPNGTAASANGVGIVVLSDGNLIDGSTATGLQLIAGNTGDGIQIDGGAADNNVVIGNYIGLDRSGAATGNGGAGVMVRNSADNNRIGGTAAGEGNVIGSNVNGITITGNSTTQTQILGNLIGTNPAGTVARANTGYGILIDQSATDSTIGGTAAGAGNTIANSGTVGIGVNGASTLNNVFYGNRIYASGGLGIDLALDGVSPNDAMDADNGANQIKNFPVLTAAMTNGAGAVTVAGSIHSAASRNYRIEFFASATADASGYGEGERYLGFVNVAADANGDASFGLMLAATVAVGEAVTATATDLSSMDTSEFSAVRLAVGSLIVTTTSDVSDGTTTSIANLIGNPGADGRISLREAILATNTTAALDTIGFGIPLVDPGHLYYTDDTVAGSVSTVQVTGFADVATPSSPVTSGYDPDYPAGTARSWYRIQLASALPPITRPVTLNPAASQPFSFTGRGPVVEVNGGGFQMFDLQPGSSAGALFSTIRGFVIGNGNFFGVRIQGSSNNVIAGNFFGTNVAGIGTGVANNIAIYVGGSAAAANDNRIGGTAAADRNVISSSTIDGIEITGGAGGAARTLVQGNYIGTDVTGTRDLGNTNQGVAIFGTLNTQTSVGGTAAGAGNLISGNNGFGVLIASAGTSGTLVQGNRIGTDAAGTAAIPNGVGIRFDAGAVANNTIGGTAASAGNVIANNVEDGIRLTTTAGIRNSILGNSIYANGGLGIDHRDDGVTLNDVGDADAGPNDLLNFPSITVAAGSAGSLTVAGRLDVPAGTYRLEFFRNAGGADPSGYGEGRTFVGSTNRTTPGGSVLFNGVVPGNGGDVITATATACTDGAVCAAFGSTSEFSNAVVAITTAVKLLSFTASPADRAVRLEWRTGSEISNLGFHLYRALSAAGPYARITNALVPGLGSSPVGASYQYRDEALQNGVRYFYKLEDVETTGRTELHGPVSAAPEAGAAGDDEPADDGDGEAADEGPAPGKESSAELTPYGDPTSVSLRILEHDSRHALLELRTGGFYASRNEDGSLEVQIPSFEDLAPPGLPQIPTRRAWVEAVAGRGVKVTSVRAFDLVRFVERRLAAAPAPAMDVTQQGIVRPARARRLAKASFRGVYPEQWAALRGTAFQLDTKKAELELAPLRYHGASGRLVLARRLRVLVEFVGREPGESLDGRRPGVGGPEAPVSPFVQLVVRQRGLYRVPFEQVFPGGRAALAPAKLRLTRLGVPVAFSVDQPAFGPGASLYFLSEGAALNPESSEVVYELARDAAGTVMAEAGAAPSGAAASSYRRRLTLEENRLYQAGLLDAPDLWLWQSAVSRITRAFSFAVDQLVPAAEPARLRVWLQGGSDFLADPDHHVRVSLNGVPVGEASWDAQKPRLIEATLTPEVLLEGANTLQVENVGDTEATSSLVFVDRFEVDYPRATAASNGILEGSVAKAGTLQVTGLGQDAIVLDTTEPAPRRLRGAVAGPGYLAFRVETGRRYFAAAPSALLAPEVRFPAPGSLRSRTNQADYLVLGPRELLPAAEPLLALRHDQGLRTLAVAVEDVYDAFGFGEQGPAAIKAFLSYAYHSWKRPSPRYVVLLGDATYDPKNYLRTGVRNLVPATTLKTSYLWTASDPAYAAVNGDDLLPDLALGRLPASTLEEARVLVDKIVAFEASGIGLSGKAVLVADNPDPAGDFERDAEEIASGALAGRPVTKLYLSQKGAAMRPEIAQAFDTGASLMSYIGHGGTAVWTSENVWNNWDVPGLAPQPMQPVLFTLSCLNGYFHHPTLNSLSEELLKVEGKGAIAAVSPSGLSLDLPAHMLHQALLTEVVSGSHERLGDAVLAAQIRYADTGSFPELLAIYNLLGDPALKIR